MLYPLIVFETATIAVPCPECGCLCSVEMRHVGNGGAVYCLACFTYITLVDDRGSVRQIEGTIEQSLRDLSRSFEIRL